MAGFSTGGVWFPTKEEELIKRSKDRERQEKLLARDLKGIVSRSQEPQPYVAPLRGASRGTRKRAE